MVPEWAFPQLYFPGIFIGLSWTENRCIHRHSPFTIHQHLDKPAQKSLKKLLVLFLKHISVYLKDVCRVPLQKGSSNLYEFHCCHCHNVVFGSGCKSGWIIWIRRNIHETAECLEEICSPSSNGSMLGPIKFLIVRSSFCLGFPTARLCSTAAINPLLVSQVCEQRKRLACLISLAYAGLLKRNET